MPPDRPPIPEALWAKVLEFLAAGKTGEVVLYVKAGQVVNGQWPGDPANLTAARTVMCPECRRRVVPVPCPHAGQRSDRRAADHGDYCQICPACGRHGEHWEVPA